MTSYEYKRWHQYLVNDCGDLRRLTMEKAEALEILAIKRNDQEMLDALAPLLDA